MPGKHKFKKLSKAETNLLERELRPYYEMGISALKASQITGYAYETCRFRWKNWQDNPDAEHLADIAERQRKSTAQFITTYDNIIYNLQAQQNKITGLIIEDKKSYEKMKGQKIKEGDEIQPYEPNWKLEEMFTKLQITIADIIDRRTAVLNAPYIDEDSEAATIERITKKLQENKK